MTIRRHPVLWGLLASILALLATARGVCGDQTAALPDPTTRPSAFAGVSVEPLGTLQPEPNLLPSGTTSLTLSLTTALPAGCRWCESPDTPYAAMSNSFSSGQGTTVHSTVVSGLADLDDRWFYVRCQDLSGGRDPDADEAQTHLRVLGPWEGDYPRIANEWGTYDPARGAAYYANYDLFIPTDWGSAGVQAAAIRALNPNAKILLTQNSSHGWYGDDPLTAEWWNSDPGDPGYVCLLRDSASEILLTMYWLHPVFNMTQPYCVALLAAQNISNFLSSDPDQGADLAYDGIYWDLLHGYITWLGDDIDADLDGHPDDPEQLNSAYKAGVESFLAQIRARLPDIVLMANESPLEYDEWINGRFYEWQLRTVLEGNGWLTWDDVASEYRQWTRSGREPRITLMRGESDPFVSVELDPQNPRPMPPALLAEAAASYRRMRYSLTTSLMGDGMYCFAQRFSHGELWWYDEYGRPRAHPTYPLSNLPSHGYLGQPINEAALLVNTLDTPDQVSNGGFESGLADWRTWVDEESGINASLTVDPTGGVGGSAGLHVSVITAGSAWGVLLSQNEITTVKDQSYTLSFWARSDVTRTLQADITLPRPPGTHYGYYVRTTVTPEWHHYHLWGYADTSASDGQLHLALGDGVGQLWVDEVQLQAGALGVWARPFENGLAVVNTTNESQTVSLPQAYCKLEGGQAPLFQVRVDDDAATASAGWEEREAASTQFGYTVHRTTANPARVMVYTPSLTYAGQYEVLAWVAPAPTQSSAVTLQVQHAGGQASTTLDTSSGDVGWRGLGVYNFEAGAAGSVTLRATGSGEVIADAIKWVSLARYNDGGPVSQITLQSHDGIILLSECERDERVYLSLIRRDP